MSFDVNLMRFKNGEPGVFPAKIVREIFGPFVDSRDGDTWFLEFPDGGGGEMTAEDDYAQETNGISISSPCGSQIYDALYRVLQQVGGVLMWSFGGCAVADTAVIPELPLEMLDQLGQPIVVRNGSEIVAAIHNT